MRVRSKPASFRAVHYSRVDSASLLEPLFSTASAASDLDLEAGEPQLSCSPALDAADAVHARQPQCEAASTCSTSQSTLLGVLQLPGKLMSYIIPDRHIWLEFHSVQRRRLAVVAALEAGRGSDVIKKDIAAVDVALATAAGDEALSLQERRQQLESELAGTTRLTTLHSELCRRILSLLQALRQWRWNDHRISACRKAYGYL